MIYTSMEAQLPNKSQNNENLTIQGSPFTNQPLFWGSILTLEKMALAVSRWLSFYIHQLNLVSFERLDSGLSKNIWQYVLGIF